MTRTRASDTAREKVTVVSGQRPYYEKLKTKMQKNKKRRVFLRAEKDLLGWVYRPSMWRFRSWETQALRDYQAAKWREIPQHKFAEYPDLHPDAAIKKICGPHMETLLIIHDEFPRMVFELTWTESEPN